ncbi:MAG: PAAR domain-containing protein [Planctomycetota bacterium]|jgi:uncharacterized Zn-binding protein involved in type VI secretion
MTRILGRLLAGAFLLLLAPMAGAIAGQPAARMNDLVLGAGPTGLILSGSSTVLVNNRPAARLGDAVLCAIIVPPAVPVLVPGVITSGNLTVLINGLPAASVGDSAGPGSCTIGTGSSTVLD